MIDSRFSDPAPGLPHEAVYVYYKNLGAKLSYSLGEALAAVCAVRAMQRYRGVKYTPEIDRLIALGGY